MLRIASFNVENLFERAKAMNLKTWDQGKVILDEFGKLNALLGEPIYTDAIKAAIIEGLKNLGLIVDNRFKQNSQSDFVIFRENKGQLLDNSTPPKVIANGRGDWIGWVELKTETVNEVATRMTARVIQDINPDILAVIEAENRNSLIRFDDQLLKPLITYREIMLIDGNDERGIDVGLLVKANPAVTTNRIESIVSHVDDMLDGNSIFSRDCPEFTIRVNPTTTILLLINHLKSKGFGTPSSSNKKRKAQAQRVREIYELRRSQGIQNIVIAGDFNDTPKSDPLSPLFDNDSELKDIFDHPNFQPDGRPGTFGNGTASGKIDYILLSPNLFQKVVAAGVWRKGVWGGKHGDLFPHYPDINNANQAASDHAAVWVDLDL